ncbi:hypothetical protein AB1M95_17070 [Sulfitobacter sp. LCG007]
MHRTLACLFCACLLVSACDAPAPTRDAAPQTTGGSGVHLSGDARMGVKKTF